MRPASRPSQLVAVVVGMWAWFAGSLPEWLGLLGGVVSNRRKLRKKRLVSEQPSTTAGVFIDNYGGPVRISGGGSWGHRFGILARGRGVSLDVHDFKSHGPDA